jgi:hypothetical protein
MQVLSLDEEQMQSMIKGVETGGDTVKITINNTSNYVFVLKHQILNQASRAMNPGRMVLETLLPVMMRPQVVKPGGNYETTMSTKNTTDFTRFYINVEPPANVEDKIKGYLCDVWISKTDRIMRGVITIKSKCTGYEAKVVWDA